MQAKVEWIDDLRFRCTTDSGHTLEMDGDGETLTPMESVLLSVGACSSVDVVAIMKKARQKILTCRCELTAERADSPPRVFQKIHARYIVSGENIAEKHLARAVELSAHKYCSVILMLTGKVEVTTSFEIEGC